MREILFRGKRLDSGEWVYGGYKYEKLGEYIAAIFIIESLTSGVFENHRVDPKSVSEFTGLTDKNGKKIFEGDIVEFYFFDKEHKNTKTMQVEWRDSGFCMRELFRNYRLADDFSIIDEKIFTYRNDVRNGVYKTKNVYFIEVIGNIYDNPELLEVTV